VVTLSEGFDDESEVEESEEQHVQLFEAREDSSESLESSKEALDLVALFIKSVVIVPRFDAVGLGRNDW
jgi:hypothetical protein